MIEFSISAKDIDEMEVDIALFDVCGIVLGSPYMYLRDVIFIKKDNPYRLIKDGISFIINVHIQDISSKCQPSEKIDWFK